MAKIDLKKSVQELGEKFAQFFQFIAEKINDFPQLSLGEQIAFPVAGLGLLLILISLILFIF